jgi:hypothetical protein
LIRQYTGIFASFASFNNFRYITESPTKDNTLQVVMRTAIPVGIFSLSIILVIAFVLRKRIKTFGGLYIFSYPPIPDYIDQIDYNKDIREQFGKLPYVPQWEFPRERVLLRKYISYFSFLFIFNTTWFPAIKL